MCSASPAFAINDQKPAGKPAPGLTVDGEEEALDRAFQVAPTDPQALIKSLEEFLARYPQSARRELVLRTIHRRALESNDPRKAAETIERLLELKPDDLDLLSSAADLFDRPGDPAARQKAIGYATRFVERAEKLTVDSRPAEIPAEKWPEAHPLIRASAYALRGRLYAKAGDGPRATADFEKSLAAYPTGLVAEQLGDAATKGGDTERAIDAFATAFIFPDRRLEPAWRDEVRKKLGSVYIAKHQSEKGLGELILTRYDELMRSLAGRFRSEGQPHTETRDPLEFPLQKLDGSPAKLADYRGKIMVLEFWATWCPPCRVEGKLFERVMEVFHDDARVVFLTINSDQDRSRVPEFIQQEAWTAPVLYAQGLDQLLGIRALPTVMILDPEGRVAFRQAGLDLTSFVPTLEGKIREVLNRMASPEP